MWTSKERVVTILSILLIAGFLITSLVSYFVARQSLSDEISQNSLPLTSDNIYSEIQQDLLRPIFISSLMAQDTFVRDWTIGGETDPDKIIRYLSEIQNQYQTVTAFFVSEQSRNYYHPDGTLKKVEADNPADRWYFRVREMNEPYEVNVDQDTADPNRLTIFINYRVFDYLGRYIGVTGVGLAVSDVKQRIETYQKRYGRSVFFIDRQGDVRMHGSAYRGPSNIRQHPGLSSHATRILTSPGLSFSYSHNGENFYINSRLVPEFDWYLVVEQSEQASGSRLLDTLVMNLLICAVITAVVLLIAHFTIGSYQKRLENMATTDKLTGAANRQMFEMMFDYTVKSARRNGHDVSAILLDIDLFKRVNDSCGHLAGDAVLQEVAERIRNRIRETDTLCRWGGEEFFLLLVNCDQAQARRVAESIRQEIKMRPVHVHNDEISITASMGVGQLLQDESLLNFFDRVDGAMYQAKKGGRDQVISTSQCATPDALANPSET